VSRVGSRRTSNTKRIVILALIGVLVASTFALVYSTRFAEDRMEEAQRKAESDARLARCGDGIARSSSYIQEYLLPSECSMPVGITVNDGYVYVASVINSKVIRYDTRLDKFEEYSIPTGRVVQEGALSIPLPIWAMLTDHKGRVWFTDAENNSIWLFNPSSNEFREFKISAVSEFGTSMPVDMKIHGNKLWFIGVYSKSLGVIDLDTLELREIPIDVNLQALGTLALDDDGSVWFTALTLGFKGYLYRLDPLTNKIDEYELPITNPVGISIDHDGNIWINDHGSSMFIMFDPSSNEFVKYVTPLPKRSTNIGAYEKCIKEGGSPLTCSGYSISLPYWNAIDSKGRVWFNEHQGNAIAVFDSNEHTLVEYHVPTQNRVWGNCEGYNEPCGIANPLRFALVDDHTVWFTEFSENKIARLDTSKELPYILSADDEYEVNKGDSITIPLTITSTSNTAHNVEMVIASSETPDGKIKGIRAEFSERVFKLTGNATKIINLTLRAEDIQQGEYTLTIGARSSDLTYSKIIRLVVK
jgi:virginiamycin B lyase